MKKQLIKKAEIAELSVIKDTNNKWIIKGVTINGKIWLLQECQEDKWLVTINTIPEAIIKTETAIEIFNNKFFVN